jgi:hypothetical protein
MKGMNIFIKLSSLLLLIPTLLFLFSCDEEVEKEVVSANELPQDNSDLSTYAKRHIEAALRIPATEKYTLSILKNNLDGDDKEDAVILVNRYQFAMDEAGKSPNPAKKAELGFMGNYNYFFYFDGGLNLISPPLAIPSSPMLPLKVSFENITSSSYKDILIDFRIRNASYKDFYTISNHTPLRIFQWKNFDGLGTSENECFVFDYTLGSYSESKDILIKKGVLGAVPKNADLFIYEPTITAAKKQETLFNFFYLPKTGKYVTKK